MRNRLFLALSALLVVSMVLAACGKAPAATTVAGPTETSAPTGRVQVRWFVGLGGGSDAGTFDAQKAIVEEYNASQDQIELVLEIITNSVAYDALATEIAAGNAPDIVGPVGIRGRDSFKGAWLDLQPYIDQYNYDLSDFDPAMVKFLQVTEEGQLGIPFGIYPSFIVYNRDLFDEAGLNYPPDSYGKKYVWPDGTEAEWNIETMSQVAQKLTVDANGLDATQAGFDAQNIQQFGFLNQYTDLRGVGTFFGAGSIVGDDGRTAQMPPQWGDALKWMYDGMWGPQPFIPNGAYQSAALLAGPGGPFSSGNLAMIHIHTWYVAPWALGGVTFKWDLAATPSYNGVVTAKMHADTFGILKASHHPDEAFQVLSYLLSPDISLKLNKIYGGLPARISLQGDYYTGFAETNFPGLTINWPIVLASIPFADHPNHESWMPAFQQTSDKYTEYFNKWSNTPGLDLNTEISALVADLQTIFDATVPRGTGIR
jgi:multiple sugar transport system substrate-binding protein